MGIQPLDPDLKSWIEVLSWVGAVIGGFFAVLKALYEVRQNRLQRAQELRWRQAQAAKQLNDEMLSDKSAMNAMYMLDSDECKCEITPGVVNSISTAEYLAALRTKDTHFSDKEMFVRDCFDDLLYFMGIFQHHISRGFVLFEDVSYPIEYYVNLMTQNRTIFEEYSRTYCFSRSLAFLEHFDAWKQAIRKVDVQEERRVVTVPNKIVEKAQKRRNLSLNRARMR